MQKIGKEVKIGLAVIGVLLTTFSYVLVKRLMQPSSASAATVADATPPGNSAQPANGASDSADRPTMLRGSAFSRPAIVPVEAKSSRFGGDAAAGASDSYMPPQAAGSTDNHPNGSPTHDDHIAAAGYGAGAGQPGDPASNPPSGYGAAPTPSADATDHHHDHSGAAAPVDPFQARGGMTADNSPPRDALPTMPASDGNRAPRQLDPSTGTTTAAASPMRTAEPRYGTPVPPPDVANASNANRGPMPSERRAASDGAAAGYPYGNSSAPPPSYPNRGGAADPGFVGNVVVDPTPNRVAAQGYAPPGSASAPYALQRNVEPPTAPQTLAVDGGAPKAGQYVVQPNDNYWTISEKVYGSGAYFKAIFEYNRNRHPQADRLQVGEALDTPDATILQRTYPDLCPKANRAASTGRVVPASARMQPGMRVYTVEEGDTLFEIARRELGRPARWGEIYQLNRDTLGSDFDYLRPGTELLLPADGGAGSQSTPVARDPSGTVLR